MRFLHARKNLDVAYIEVDTGADRAEHGLPCSGRAVDFKAQTHQVFDHLLNLVFTCGFLHCDDHRKSALTALAISAVSSQLHLSSPALQIHWVNFANIHESSLLNADC